MTTITAANTIFTIAIINLYPVAQQIQGYAADDVTDAEAQVIGEGMMGVDGILTAGYINVPFVQTINLMGDSPSNDIFDAWAAAENQIQDKYAATGLIVYPSLGRKLPLVKGFLTSYKPIPAGKKVLQPRAFTVTWQRGAMQPV